MHDLSKVKVNGVPILETDIESFSDFDSLSEWTGKLWEVLDETYPDFPKSMSEEEIFGEEFNNRLTSKWKELVAKQRDAERMQPIEIGEQVYTPITSFDFAHVGWESDAIGWIATDPHGNKVIVLTNHGQPYIAPREELANQIAWYKKLVDSTQQALDLLN